MYGHLIVGEAVFTGYSLKEHYYMSAFHLGAHPGKTDSKLVYAGYELQILEAYLGEHDLLSLKRLCIGSSAGWVIKNMLMEMLCIDIL